MLADQTLELFTKLVGTPGMVLIACAAVLSFERWQRSNLELVRRIERQQRSIMRRLGLLPETESE